MVRFDIRADKTALLIIDMQNGFLKPGAGAERSRGREIIPRLNKLIHSCREKHILPIFTQAMHRPDRRDVGLSKVFLPESALASLSAGTSGVDIHPEMDWQKDDITIPKLVYDAFHGTGLDDILRFHGIDTLIIGGVDTLLCCESTAREARQRNYRVIFLSDGTATGDQPDMGWGPLPAELIQKFVLTVMALRFAEVATVDEVVARIKSL